MRKIGLVSVLLASLAATGVQAQEYPTREIRLMCGFPAGSGADIMYRHIAEKLSALAGKPVLVENRPGVQGHLAHVHTARAKPDGYTLSLQGGSSLASINFLLKNPPVDPLKDFDYIGMVLRQGWYLSVDAKSPIKTIAELTAHLKQKGAKGSYAVSTNTGIVFAELYKAAAGLETVQVNYKTIMDSINDLAAGNVDMSMTDPPFTIASIRAGRFRAIAVSTGTRVNATPDIPTMAESGVPGIDVDVWWSMQGPAGMPAPVRDKLAGWLKQIVNSEETKKFYVGIGTDPLIGTGEETRALIVKDMDRWRDWVKRAKIEPQ
jgi:tripartite-type tricarboxylate transporter receptor subunit TctC